MHPRATPSGISLNYGSLIIKISGQTARMRSLIRSYIISVSSGTPIYITHDKWISPQIYRNTCDFSNAYTQSTLCKMYIYVSWGDRYNMIIFNLFVQWIREGMWRSVLCMLWSLFVQGIAQICVLRRNKVIHTGSIWFYQWLIFQYVQWIMILYITCCFYSYMIVWLPYLICLVWM